MDQTPKMFYADVNDSFNEFLIASGVGKMTFNISDVCKITLDHYGRELRYVDVEDELEDG